MVRDALLRSAPHHEAGRGRVTTRGEIAMAKHHDTLPILGALERKVLWLASWMIHNANHLRDNGDGLKVGGHQASSASLATIMTALSTRYAPRIASP